MHKLLIVDGSATMRKIIMRVLRQAEIQVETVLEASNGLEALEQLTTHPDVNLVLSDVNMPEMNGIDLVRRVRESKANDQLPIIMVTTESCDAMREQALQGGANGYVCKPFTPETFSQALDPYLD
jgi:two-component system chemotaxis response regulator CheY